MASLEQFRSALHRELGAEFLRAGRQLTAVDRERFAARALEVVEKELGTKPNVELRKAIQLWSWALHIVPSPQRKVARRPRRKHPRVAKIERRDGCLVYRLRKP